MQKNFSPGDKVLYKTGFLAYPSVFVSVKDNKATLALAPQGNLTESTTDYKSWETVQAPVNKIKHYSW
ncbi:MAG: hypothetical protein ACKOW9_02165 [Candidatus Paceibacterota bacterium]